MYLEVLENLICIKNSGSDIEILVVIKLMKGCDTLVSYGEFGGNGKDLNKEGKVFIFDFVL